MLGNPPMPAYGMDLADDDTADENYEVSQSFIISQYFLISF